MTKLLTVVAGILALTIGTRIGWELARGEADDRCTLRCPVGQSLQIAVDQSEVGGLRLACLPALVTK